MAIDERVTKRVRRENALETLKAATTIVADTGDVEAIRRLRPQDATTNPSLIKNAADMPQYRHLVEDAISFGKLCAASATFDESVAQAMDRLSVNFGREILGIVPGYVSTEVDARLSYDTNGTVERARRIIAMYEEQGIDKGRVLIKIASTWEGIKACEVLEAEGIRCNMTLLFSLAQAAACAEAGATLISPFVGRIMDWYKARDGVDGFAPAEDPGVRSVTRIYNYYKKHGYKTIVMGASFRNVGEITELCGCDRLTIAPKFLDALADRSDELPVKLTAEDARACDVRKIDVAEPSFRLRMANDPMATEKLAEGIRKFVADIAALEDRVRDAMRPAESAYEQLARHTTIVADTGDIAAIRRLGPQDATTNPSLLYKAATMEAYEHLVADAVDAAASRAPPGSAPDMGLVIDRLSVNFGREILGIVPGYVSTEVDARLSYDTNGTVERARRIIAMYEEQGIDKGRVLIKIASTWEGIKACEVLEAEGIRCNMTLLFSLAQAAACAEAGATLISPFVGRIMDWYKARDGVDGFAPAEDPGVRSVTRIYNYYKKHGYKTIVMGASFRNVGEITELCGCDRLTIAPKLIHELRQLDASVPRKLSPDAGGGLSECDKLLLDESSFRLAMSGDAMATEKLASGIRNFSADLVKLEDVLRTIIHKRAS